MDEEGRRRVGEKCRLCRNERKWTQEVLSERIGLSVNEISYIENGKTKSAIPIDTLLRFAEAFEVSTDYLLGRKLKPNLEEGSYEPEKNKMISKIIENTQVLDLRDLRLILDMSERLRK